MHHEKYGTTYDLARFKMNSLFVAPQWLSMPVIIKNTGMWKEKMIVCSMESPLTRCPKTTKTIKIPFKMSKVIFRMPSLITAIFLQTGGYSTNNYV